MRVAGQDELGDALVGVLLDEVGDLGVAADQRRPRSAAHEPDARPQARVDLQVVDASAVAPVALVQGEHALLPDRVAPPERLLRRAHVGGVDRVQQAAGLRPRLLGGVAGDDVQPDAEPQRPSLPGGESPHPGDLLRNLGGRLAPGEVRLDVPRRDRARSRRRAAEVQLGHRVGPLGHRGALHLVVRAGEVVRGAAPGPAHDGEELVGARVPLVLRQMVAETALLGALPAGDDVEQQAPAGDPLVGRGHLGGQGGGDEARPEGHEELQPRGLLGERGGDQPGVLAPGARRGEHRLEAELLGRPGDLAEVVDGGRPEGAGGGPSVPALEPVAAADDRAAVPGGGQEPVELQILRRHCSGVLLDDVVEPAVGEVGEDDLPG